MTLLNVKSKFILILINTIIFLTIGQTFATSSSLAQSNNNINESFINLQSQNNTSLNSNVKNFNNSLSNLNIYANSCILIEKSTGRTVYEKNSEEKLYPASTTKVLTAIITLEKCNLSDSITITTEMISQVPLGYTTAYLQPGEIVTVEQLLNLLLIPSANDAGFALAIYISGSTENFAKLMNEKSKEFGCTNSNFTNPCGIHNENHYSTARDIGIIGMKALEYSEITKIASKTSYTLITNKSNSKTFSTTNTLLKKTENNYYEYATGLKTGFTSPAGSCIIATANKNNMEFLAVILDAPEPQNGIIYRDIDCTTLFEYGFANFEEITKIEELDLNYINIDLKNNNNFSILFKVLLLLCITYLILSIIKKEINKK